MSKEPFSNLPLKVEKRSRKKTIYLYKPDIVTQAELDAQYDEIKRLKAENDELKELAKKNNDWNIVTANLAQRRTINILKEQLKDRDSRIEKAIDIGNSNLLSFTRLSKMMDVLEGTAKEPFSDEKRSRNAKPEGKGQ